MNKLLAFSISTNSTNTPVNIPANEVVGNVVNATPSAHTSSVGVLFTVLNWFLIVLPFIMIVIGIILLVKKKIVGGVILIVLAFPLTLLLFVIASVINSAVVG